jgi:hypothetical protein
VATADPTSRVYERLARHRFGWLAEPMADEPSFVLRPMFGCLACYLHGRLVLVLADRRPPWRGLLVPTAREAHAALRADFPALEPHPVLPKWLFLPEGTDDLETIGAALVERALADDPRLGVEPTPRRHAKARGRRVRGSR